MEFLDIGTDLQQHFFGFGDHFGIMAVWVFANVFQRHRDHFSRRIKKVHTTITQFGHVVGVEDQLKRIYWRVFTQNLFHLPEVHTDTCSAPHIIDGIGVLRVILLGPTGHDIPHIFDVRQLRHIEFLECASSYLALEERARWHNHVIAGATCQHLCFQHFVAVENVVDQFKTSFFFKLGQQFFVDIVGPVVNAYFFGKRGAGHQGHRCGTGQKCLDHLETPIGEVGLARHCRDCDQILRGLPR